MDNSLGHPDHKSASDPVLSRSMTRLRGTAFGLTAMGATGAMTFALPALAHSGGHSDLASLSLTSHLLSTPSHVAVWAIGLAALAGMVWLATANDTSKVARIKTSTNSVAQNRRNRR